MTDLWFILLAYPDPMGSKHGHISVKKTDDRLVKRAV